MCFEFLISEIIHGRPLLLFRVFSEYNMLQQCCTNRQSTCRDGDALTAICIVMEYDPMDDPTPSVRRPYSTVQISY